VTAKLIAMKKVVRVSRKNHKNKEHKVHLAASPLYPHWAPCPSSSSVRFPLNAARSTLAAVRRSLSAIRRSLSAVRPEARSFSNRIEPARCGGGDDRLGTRCRHLGGAEDQTVGRRHQHSHRRARYSQLGFQGNERDRPGSGRGKAGRSSEVLSACSRLGASPGRQ